jgi:hypothetical protein
MATESVTKMVNFDCAPTYPSGLFQVNAGIDTGFALSTASIVLGYVQERLSSAAVNGQVEDEAYVLALLTDMAHATYKACGAVA